MKFCTKCGMQLQDDAVFCHECGCIASQYTKQQSKSNRKKTFNNVKSSYRKLTGFNDVGDRLKKVAKVISYIWMVLFSIIVIIAGIGCLLNILRSLIYFDIEYLLISFISILLGAVLLFLLFFIVHVSLWKLYAYGDIYNSLCKTKNNEDNDTLNN